MVDAMRSLGVVVTERDDGWLVTPAPLHGPAHVACGLAGTVMRFVPPMAALATGAVHFDGDQAARERPMAVLIGALRGLGVEVDDDGRGVLPFVVRGAGRVMGGSVTIDASASSQFVSALLLSGARYDEGITVRHVGPPFPSAPHVEMTVAMLRRAGVDVHEEDNVWRVAPGPIESVDIDVEPDLSSAAPFLAAALVAGGSVRVPGWPAHTTQAGALLPELLRFLGGESRLDGTGLTVRGSGQVRGIDADLREIGELTPVLAALAALGDTPSRFTGIAHLRGHETDRLAALARELTGHGAEVVETADGLAIRPGPLTAGVFHTYGDHRMAQAGALLGLAVDGVEVEDVGTTAKTLPDFVGMWTGMLGTAA